LIEEEGEQQSIVRENKTRRNNSSFGFIGKDSKTKETMMEHNQNSRCDDSKDLSCFACDLKREKE
jgi:hypothetical protein